MGKGKQAQRTKNNARPSNSSRSAEFLGTTAHNLVGFSALKDNGITSSSFLKDGGFTTLLPSLTISTIRDVDMKTIDSKFHLVLKKMNKKDSTTKLKALQEFIELCQHSESAAIEGLLLFWSRIYGQLANDIEHKVRETSQLAHASVAKSVGKNIAIHLKQLAGPWFVSRYDTYPPAASAAVNSFNETFPPNKLVTAIVHCQEEILKYISEIVASQALQSQSKKAPQTVEEIETKHQRLLVSSLQAYSFYLKTVPFEEIEKTVDIHRIILGKNSKYWKLASHESPLVKTGFFNVLASVIENAVFLCENEKKRVMTAIINSLEETDPGLLSAVWEAMLIAVTKIEDWFEVVNIEKFVLPTFWRILKNGAQCCATVMYPNLLPFLGQFPKFNLNSKDLFTNFFNNMREGFMTKNIKLTHSQSSAIVTSFIECLRYAVLINSSNSDTCESLLKQQLIPATEFCLTDCTSYSKILFSEIAKLIRYWTKQSNDSECDTYSHLVDTFWLELDTIFNKLSTTAVSNFEEANLSSVFNSQIDLLLALKNSPAPKSNKKVKFLDDSSPEVKPTTEIVNPKDDRQFLIRLDTFIYTLCTAYFKKVNSESPKRNIQRFVKLVSNFESKPLFIALAKSLSADADLMTLHETISKNWLEGKMEETQAGVQLIFAFLKYMDDPNQEIVLNSLLQLNSSIVLKSAVQCALSKQNRNNKIIKSWCTHFDIGLVLKEVAETTISSESMDVSERNKQMILLAFETSDDGVPLISNEAIYAVVSTLCTSLRETNSTYIAHLISQLLEFTRTYKELSDSSLFSANCYMLETLFGFNTENETKEDTIRCTWKQSICGVSQTIPHFRFIDLVRTLSKILWQKTFQMNSEISMLVIEGATDFIESLIKGSNYCEIDKNKEIIKAFLMELDLRNWITNLAGIVLHAEIVTGNLHDLCVTSQKELRIYEDFICFDINNVFVDYSENCLKWTLFTTKLLNNLLSRMHEEECEEDSRSLKSITFSNVVEVFINVIHVFTLGKVYKKHYKSTKHYTNSNNLLGAITREFATLKKFLNADIREEIVCFFKSNVNSKILPHILHTYHTEFEPDVTPSMYFEGYQDILTCKDESKRKSYVQGVQILSPYFDEEKVLHSLNLVNCTFEEALVIARSMLTDRTQELRLVEFLNEVILSSKSNPCSSLYDRIISEFSSDVALTLEIVHCLTKLVIIVPTKLSTDHWDFIMTSLVELQVSILETITWYGTQNLQFHPMQVLSFIIAISKLYCAVQELINKHEKESIEGLPSALLDEWKNVFVVDVQAGIARIWMHYVDFYDQQNLPTTQIVVLNALGTAIKLLNGKVFCQKRDDKLRISTVMLDEVIQSSLKLLQSPVPNLQLGGYYMLNHAIPELIERDKLSIVDDNFNPKCLTISIFEEILSNMQNIVNTMLMDFRLCDTISCTIQPFTDSYTYTLGYLLSWAVMLNMCAEAHGDLRYQYAELLKDNYFSCLMNTIFKLMPVEVLQDNKTKSPKLFDIFSNTPSFEFAESWTEWRLDHIACWMYSNCLRYLPVLVRQWWSTTDSRVGAAIDKITSFYVSPMLCQEELQNNQFSNIENMQVKVHSSAREVIALYQMDDTKLELSIVLPINHPLGAVTITPCQYVGGTANWRNCHMQLSILLTHQNGSLWDGLMLWKTNLDKRFAGVEECCICFSVFHISTYQIPKSTCHTCRKKFHTTCLYKWFNTSQKSSCPICRNVF